MKVSIALIMLAMLASSSLATSAEPVVELTQEDYESLIYYSMFHYGISRRQAIKDMGVCVYNAGKLGWEIYQLCQAFRISLVTSIIKRVTTCINKCQSFQYLTLTPECGRRVRSAAGNLKKNFNLYKLLKDRSAITTGIKQLRSDLLVIEKACVADPDALAALGA